MSDENHNLIEPLEPMTLGSSWGQASTAKPWLASLPPDIASKSTPLQDNYDFIRWDKINKDIEELTESIKLAKHAIEMSSFYLRTVTSMGEFTSNCHYNIIVTNTEKL